MISKLKELRGSKFTDEDVIRMATGCQTTNDCSSTKESPLESAYQLDTMLKNDKIRCTYVSAYKLFERSST